MVASERRTEETDVATTTNQWQNGEGLSHETEENKGI
jgi:hypothetical protein